LAPWQVILINSQKHYLDHLEDIRYFVRG